MNNTRLILLNKAPDADIYNCAPWLDLMKNLTLGSKFFKFFQARSQQVTLQCQIATRRHFARDLHIAFPYFASCVDANALDAAVPQANHSPVRAARR